MKKAGIFILIVMAFISCKPQQKEEPEESVPVPFGFEDSATSDSPDVYDDVYDEQVQNGEVYDLELSNLNSDLASEGQKVIFSFKTQNGKTLSLLTDAGENYLVYRYGTPQNVELQYPNPVTGESWKKFRFEGYKTPTLYLMHVIFDNSGTKYIIYYNKFTKTPNDNKIGVQVVTGNKRKDIRGKMNTLKGSLEYFRHNDKILKTW